MKYIYTLHIHHGILSDASSSAKDLTGIGRTRVCKQANGTCFIPHKKP